MSSSGTSWPKRMPGSAMLRMKRSRAVSCLLYRPLTARPPADRFAIFASMERSSASSMMSSSDLGRFSDIVTMNEALHQCAATLRKCAATLRHLRRNAQPSAEKSPSPKKRAQKTQDTCFRSARQPPPDATHHAPAALTAAPPSLSTLANWVRACPLSPLGRSRLSSPNEAMSHVLPHVP